MVAQASVSRARQPLSILISDQDEGVRKGLRRSLEPREWEFYEARSGREALQILRRRVVHVLVSAVELPDTTGFDVARGLSRLDHWVPFIFTVSEVNKEMLLRALVARAFTVLQKPVDGRLFRATLEHLVGRWYRGGVSPGWDRHKTRRRRPPGEQELL